MAEGDHTILSLDLSSNTGWAIVRNGTILKSGVISLYNKDAHPGNRFLRFHNWLIDQFSEWEVREIFYEDVPRFESAAAAKVYCGLLAILQMLCITHRIRSVSMKPGTVKKEFVGKGNAKKEEICKVAHRLGWKNGFPDTDIDHDEADAIAVAFAILKRRGIDPRLAN